MTSIRRFLSRINAVADVDKSDVSSEKPVELPNVVIDQLSIQYGSHIVLQQASLNAPAGQVVALVGPSGCGKSSLLSAINRMTDSVKNCQVTGHISVGGENVLLPRYSVDRLRQRVGMVFQQPNPFPLSVADNIDFPLRDHGMRSKAERRQRMEEVLNETGLWSELKNRLHVNAMTLSGGQQQRLCIARALALRPNVLLLDEPCSALDPLSTEKIEQLICTLKGQITMIMVTHNLAQARRVADRVAVCWMNEGCGCIVECDTTQIIFEQASSPITQAYCRGLAG